MPAIGRGSEAIAHLEGRGRAGPCHHDVDVERALPSGTGPARAGPPLAAPPGAPTLALCPTEGRDATHLGTAPYVTPVDLWVGVVVVAGLLLFARGALAPDAFSALARPGPLAAFGVLLVGCELRPLRVPRKAGVEEVVASSTFAFAILLVYGAVAASLVQSAASATADLVDRKPLRKIAFNIGQYCVSWHVAGIVFSGSYGAPHLARSGLLSWSTLLAIGAAAVSYFVVNTALVSAVICLDVGRSFPRHLLTSLQREVTSDFALLALAPVVVVTAERSLALLPLLLFPVVAVYRTAAATVELEHQATHDPLTDLPNRSSLQATLAEVLPSAGKGGSPKAAVLLIDLDRFKEINDTLGHHTGDGLLRLIGPRIKTAAPEAVSVARLGGDEFAVLFDDVVDAAHARQRAERICAALEEPFRVGDNRLDVEASIGVALCPDDGEAPELLLQRADIAMYLAKFEHLGVEFYDRARDPNSRDRLGLLGDLRQALNGDEITLFFQPKLDLASGSVRSVEALVRWHHPERGLIAPDEFIPLAERSGLIGPLTRHILHRAVAQAKRWQLDGSPLAVAVNLSARNLHDRGIVDDLVALRRAAGLPAELIELEITESSTMSDPNRAALVLDALAATGSRLAIDDFGTGYSSLAYLQRLPVSEVKVDKSFVGGMVRNDGDRSIVRSTIDLAHNLGLYVTAEGVEDQATLECLRAAGCDTAQGYYISRPLPAAELDVWLRSHRQAICLA
jgi:diguanylate cyclase (GGDEF)-like protein